MKFSVGDKVVEKKTLRAHTSYNIQKVVGCLDGALLLDHYGCGFDDEIHEEDYQSKPGTRGWRESLQRFQEEELCTIAEAQAEILRLEVAKAELDDEFEAVRDQVQEKLAQAAKLAGEAAELIDKCDRSFEDLIQECGPLYKALDKGGWRHSTMRCKYG